MSRGLGVWQRRLLDAVNDHVPETASDHLRPRGFLPVELDARIPGPEPTEAERQAVYRAARTLTARGLIRRGKYGAEFFRAEQEVGRDANRSTTGRGCRTTVDDQAAGWIVRIYEDNATSPCTATAPSWATRDEARAAVRADLGGCRTPTRPCLGPANRARRLLHSRVRSSGSPTGEQTPANGVSMDMWLWVVTIAAADGGFDEDGTGGLIGPFGTREIAEKFAAALAKHRGYPDDEVKVEAMNHPSDYRVEEWYADMLDIRRLTSA